MSGIYGYMKNNTVLGYTNIVNKNLDCDSKPFTKSILKNTYSIVFNGKIYNSSTLRDSLMQEGYLFETNSDDELALIMYIHYKEKCTELLDGYFAFAILDEQLKSLFLCRDRLGIKPLFYTKQHNIFAFASQIKTLLKLDEIKASISLNEICEIFGLGPAHTPGKTYFKDIFEILPGHYAYVKNGILNATCYWDLTIHNILDDELTSISKIRELVIDSTKRQLNSNENICTMLSGGLDSSIITAIAKNNIPNLHTFSINFEGNDTDFTGSSYQPTKDSDYVKIMCENLNLNHTNIYFNNNDLFDSLKDAVIARDMPGMADIDSSMLVFCREISKNGYKVALSGECSDEIFGGYPWYYKPHLIKSDTFPWARSVNLRKSIINKDIVSEEELEKYITQAYNKTCEKVKHTSDSEFENTFRKTCYLTIKWFMNTLIERTDRMSTLSNLEVRVPFADYKIFEYVYNLSAKIKLGITNDTSESTEKYLLRKAFEDILPESIVYRKKSPFPKTYDPKYLELLENELQKILNNPSSPILQFIDKDYVENMMRNHGKNLTENWFGQLMTYPQTLAYLIQVNMWFDIYKPEFEI